MKTGIHLQKKLRQIVTKDGGIVTYKLVSIKSNLNSYNVDYQNTGKQSTNSNVKTKTKSK